MEVLYKKNSLKKEHKNLKLIVIKILNNGTEHILKTSYLDEAPFGIKLLNNKIVEAPEVRHRLAHLTVHLIGMKLTIFLISLPRSRI